MKILATFKTQASGLASLAWPDSAMIRSGKPLFIPEESPRYFAHIGFGARIDAVGKSVAERFAPRYYNEIAPFAFILTEEISDAITEGESPKAAGFVYDYALICGNFVPVEGMKQDLTLSASVSFPGETGTEEESVVCDWRRELAETISEASKFNTLKTGDMAVRILPLRLEAKCDNILKINFGDNFTLLENKLK